MVGLVVAVILFVLFMGSVVFFALKQNKKTKKLMTAYAIQHGWTFDTPTPELSIYKKIGYSNEKSLIEGNISDRRFWLYNVWVGTGRSRLNYPLFVIEMSAELPSMIIEPQVGHLRTSNLQTQINFGLVPLEVEGDFNKYYQIYIQQSQQQIALEYLTPDVMSIIESNFKSGLMFSDNYLVINATYAKDKEQLDNLITNVQILIQKW